MIHYTRRQPAPPRTASVVTWGAPNAQEDLRSLGVNVLQFTSFVHDTPDDTSVSTPSVTLHGIETKRHLTDGRVLPWEYVGLRRGDRFFVMEDTGEVFLEWPPGHYKYWQPTNPDDAAFEDIAQTLRKDGAA